MAPTHRISKGLDLPILGKPEQVVHEARPCTRVALLAADYPGLRPQFEVEAGQRVRRGQRLFHDKKSPGILFTAPAAGSVTAIHRGERRALISVEIELDPAEREGAGEQVVFDSYTGSDPAGPGAEAVRALLLESGLWTALRTRPYSRIPEPGTSPAALFVTAVDTHPLAPDPEVVLAGREEDFAAGLRALARLTSGPRHLCISGASRLEAPPASGFSVERFEGPHPSGTPGLHIHLLHPVHRKRSVWHIGYQDVAAIGALFRNGRLDSSRIISLAGPGVRRPRLLRTRLGALLPELVAGELAEGEQRVISGSVLGGRAAHGGAEAFLGRHHHQVTVLPEGRERRLLGWLRPGRDIFSVTNAFLSAFRRGCGFAFSTTTHGSARPMVPIGTYERVMPLDMEPTYLLRSLIMGDAERAEALGCLELDEEDLALCSFVCPGKYEYGPMLREILERIHRESR
ncbi:MAG TPA: Na(+)-translocating NADH-quinone reductase subunit A [Burkholderiales bacterium]